MSKPESLENGLQAGSVRLVSAAPRREEFKLKRRSFLVRTALGTAAALIAGKDSGVLGVNDAVRIGVAGLNGRGPLDPRRPPAVCRLFVSQPSWRRAHDDR